MKPFYFPRALYIQFLALVLVGSALGQAPTPIPAPLPPPVPVVKPSPVASATVPPGPLYAGDLFVIDGSASVGDSIDWEMISPPDCQTFAIDSGGKTVAFANKAPGTYVMRVEADSVIDGKIVKSKQRIAFTTISATPAPTPAPVPGPVPPSPPTPTPSAYTGKVHATLVFDLDEPSTAQLRASTVKADLAGLDASWYVAPTGGPVAKMFAAYTTADGLPTVYFTDDSGKMLGKPLKAPTSKDQVVATLKAIRGVK